ncbi:MAG: alpha/beta hydrolase, partial [Planctomycetes bacterium]|nr:alpha/beta hydrolase [Planctomycetota bacterium]
DGKKPYLLPLQDLHRSIRIVRSKATEWKIDPKRLGVMGFSAGGHLSAMSSAFYVAQGYKPVDAIDKLDPRPSFVALIYPAYLGNAKTDPEKLDPLVQVSPKTPPTFIAITHDDGDRALFAALYYAKLRQNRVPAELHIYSKGGHGYGLRPSKNPVSSWPARLEDWLRSSGWLKKK